MVPAAVAGDVVVTEVADINSGVADSNPAWLTPFGGGLFFSATGRDGERLYKTDGETVTKFDIGPGSGRHYPAWLTPFQGELFFNGRHPDGTGPPKLFKTDGKRVVEIPEPNPGEFPYAQPEFLTPVGDEMFFRSAGWRRLFKTDGETVTDLGIKLVLHLHSMRFLRPLLVPLGNELLYAGLGPNGWELFRTDGMTVTQAFDINPGKADSNPEWLTALDGQLFFAATGLHGRELFKVIPEPASSLLLGVGLLFVVTLQVCIKLGRARSHPRPMPGGTKCVGRC